MIGLLAEGEATGIFNTPTLWAEFFAAVLGIAVIAIWRLVNKYLPPDEHGPPPVNVAAAAVSAMTDAMQTRSETKERPVSEQPDEVPVLDEVDETETAGDDAGPAPKGWTPEGSDPGEEFTPEPVKGDE